MIVSGLDSALHLAGIEGSVETTPDSLLRWVTYVEAKTDHAALRFKVKGADYTAKVLFPDGHSEPRTETLKDTDMDFYLMDSTPVTNAPAVATLALHLLKAKVSALAKPEFPHIGKTLKVCIGAGHVTQTLAGVKPIEAYTKLSVGDLYQALLDLVDLQLVHGKSPDFTIMHMSALLRAIEESDSERELLKGLMIYALDNQPTAEFVHDESIYGVSLDLATLLVNSVIGKCKACAVEKETVDVAVDLTADVEDEDDSDHRSKQLLTVDEALARLPTIGVDLGSEVAMGTIRDIAVRLGLFPASQVNIIELNHIIDLIYSKFPKPKADTDLPVKRPTKQRAAKAKSVR